MHIKKTLIAAGVAGAIGLVSLVGLASADNQPTSLVDRLAQRFNLNRQDVQKVFDEDRQAHQAVREQNYETGLAQAVKDGKLTEEQKTKLIAKHKELQSQLAAKRANRPDKHQTMAALGQAERQQIMAQHRAEADKLRQEITDWEQANNIPAGYLFMGHGGLAGPGDRGHGQL